MPPEMPDTVGNAPAPAEIRTAAERMITSEVFARSPQLGAFLRFVTDATLPARATASRPTPSASRCSGATVRSIRSWIRSSRVEDAAAPRDRALLRGAGQDEPIVIDLPRGLLCRPSAGARAPLRRLPRSAASSWWTQCLSGIPVPAARIAAVAVVAIVLSAVGYVSRQSDVTASTQWRATEPRRSAARCRRATACPWCGSSRSA